MFQDLNRIIEQVGKDKGIGKEILIQAVEAAMLAVSKKKFGATREIEARYNPDLGEVELFQFKTVVETVRNPGNEISLKEARQIDPEVELGDSLGMKLDSSSFGRIAAQTAKQVIVQRIREAEREIIFNEYANRKGELVNGIVQRFEHGSIIVDLGRTEAVLPPREQIPGENWRRSDRIRALLVDITKSTKTPQLVISRVHPDFLVSLFELEVPEIREGIVKIVAAVREPGSRAKIAVASCDRDVDPVGACVGMKGSRVQAVVAELKGEKIDVIPHSEDVARFIWNALSPAQISKVMVDDLNKSIEVVVPNTQLSLAIGKRGQNVRLAAKLTGWRIDIRGEEQEAVVPAISQVPEPEAAVPDPAVLMALPGVGEKLAANLVEVGFITIEALAKATEADLSVVPGIGAKKAESLIQAAREAIKPKGE